MRKAGITKLEKGDLKLELSPEAPVKPKRNKKQVVTDSQDELIPSDSLSEEELLFYSAGGVPPEFKES